MQATKMVVDFGQNNHSYRRPIHLFIIKDKEKKKT